MITGVKFLYDVVLYGIILQYGMANSMEGCRMMSRHINTKEDYKAMYFH